jgi:hypothetical protein
MWTAPRQRTGKFDPRTYHDRYQARFRGVSKALVQRLEARARTLGLGECVLETTQTALRFYESLGYVKSEQSYPLSLTGLPATVLRKVLEPRGCI